jgi:UDPglucose--hexose-1-phosphate uridylyltransferase
MEFKSITKNALFHDPFNNFELTERPTEIRIDPLTGRTSRIIYFPATLPPPADQTRLAEFTKQFCPFCRPAVFERTPRFPENILPAGRIVRGNAVVFPNAFPYDTHSAVGVVTEGHYVKMDSFDWRELADGIMAGRDYLARINALFPECVNLSINMNYMPLAGGSILHPHIQLIASDTPTNYQREIVKHCAEYQRAHKVDYFSDLIRNEEILGERFITRLGTTAWVTSFAPMGITEFFALFEDGRPITEASDETITDFARGLTAASRFLASANFMSFNFSIYSAIPSEPSTMTHARIVPRVQLPPVGASDVNYFEMLHHEVLTILRPEETAVGAKHYFNEITG